MEDYKVKKVLIIDDSKLWLNAIEEILKKVLTGVEIIYVECFCVSIAIQTIITQQPDILFLDHSLSGVFGHEGFEILDNLNLNKLKTIKIFSTTSSCDHVTIGGYKNRGIEIVGKNWRNILEKIKEN